MVLVNSPMKSVNEKGLSGVGCKSVKKETHEQKHASPSK